MAAPQWKGTPVTRGPGAGFEQDVRVLIVDDHQLFAEAVQITLEDFGMRVEGVATTAEEGLRRARELRPDLVLLDIGLPDRSGLAVGRALIEELPATKVVSVTALDDAQTIDEARRIGFAGYLTKDTPISQFARSLRTAMGGTVVISRPRRTLEDVEDHGAALLARQLTARELEVLALLVDGMSGREIARELCISTNTVRTHIQNILTKLQVRSRLEAVAFAVRHRIVQIDHRRDQIALP
jgi:two-component system nitrate/nitrite response regulator NarL